MKGEHKKVLLRKTDSSSVHVYLEITMTSVISTRSTQQHHQKQQYARSIEVDILLKFESFALLIVASIFLLAPTQLAHIMFVILPESNEKEDDKDKRGSDAALVDVIAFCISLIGAFQLGVVYLLRRKRFQSLSTSASVFREMFILLHSALFLLGVKMKISHPSICKPTFYFFLV